jgi:hypothetical protein
MSQNSQINNWYIKSINHQKPLTKELLKDIEDNISEIDWDKITWNNILPEDFIRKYQDKLDWNNISSRQILSEDFIREFHDKVNWYSISYCQYLSNDFIIEFSNYIHLELLLINKNVSPEIKELYKTFI